MLGDPKSLKKVFLSCLLASCCVGDAPYFSPCLARELQAIKVPISAYRLPNFHSLANHFSASLFLCMVNKTYSQLGNLHCFVSISRNVQCAPLWELSRC